VKRALTLIVLIAMAAVAAWPLLRPYQVAGHSAYVDLSRAEAFHEAMRHGVLLPRWLPDFYYQYGSPIFNFYAPLSYYVVEFFRLAGASGQWALKLAYAAFWLAALLGMYVFAAEAIDPDGAVAAAAAYGVAPYLLIDVYVRAGIAEFACFAWLPWLLWALRRTVRGVGRFGAPLAALAYAGLILTHNITAMIATPLLIAFALAAADEWRSALKAGGALALGLALAAFFWAPALIEMKYVHATRSLTGGFFEFHRHFLTLADLFRRRWSFGASVPGPDGMGHMFGEACWAGTLGVFALAAFPRSRKTLNDLSLPLFFGGAAAFCLLMTTSASAWLWRGLPLLAFAQFPWRFLLPATLFGAAALAVLPAATPAKFRPFVAWGLAAAAFAASLPYMQARYIFQDRATQAPVIVFAKDAPEAAASPQLQRPDQYLTIETIRALAVSSTARDDYLPVACDAPPDRAPAAPAEPGGEAVKIVSARRGWPPSVVVEADAEAAADVVFNQFYFPGWAARIDGVAAPVGVQPKTGRMLVTIGPGRHVVAVQFGDTPVRLTARLISVFGLVVWLLQLFLIVRTPR
jgi:hypothetical protein